MANFREYSTRLAAMSGMRRVTATMKMVAASHLHRAQNELRQPEPFAEILRGLLPVVRGLNIAGHRVCAAPPARGSRILLVVMSAHRGLCGSFNSSVIREVRRWTREQAESRGARLEALYAGHKGYAALKAELVPCMTPLAVAAHPTSKETAALSRYAMDGFLAGRYDEVWVASNRFVSTLTQETTVRRLLPFEAKVFVGEGEPPEIIEPGDDRMIAALARQWLHLKVYTCLLHSVASEHAARVMAMENATVNLRRMEKELVLLRNRARQAAITKELTEIVGGAESLG